MVRGRCEVTRDGTYKVVLPKNFEADAAVNVQLPTVVARAVAAVSVCIHTRTRAHTCTHVF